MVSTVKSKRAAVEKASATVAIPFAPPASGYCSTRIETRLTARQAAALKAVLTRLRDAGEFCDFGGVSDPRGKRVEETPHAVRYMLDRVADAFESQTGADLVRDYQLSF